MKGFGDAKPRTGNSPRMGELVPVIDWPENDYTHVRLVGPVYAYCHIWFNIATKLKPAPKGTSIPKLCLDLDGETDEFVVNNCPYRKSGKGREAKFYAVNVIVRDLQENGNFGKPKNIEVSKHLGYKGYWGTKNDAKKTPIRVLIVSENAAQKIQNLRKLNKAKVDGDTKTFDVSDPEYGCDIGIMINSKAKGAAKIEVQKGDRTPLTPEEKRYIMFPLDLLKPARLDEAKRDMEDLAKRIISKSKDDDDDGSSRKSKKSRPSDDDDDDVAGLSDDDLNVDDDDDDDAPKKGKKDKNKKSSKKKSRDDDDDDDDDLDLDADLDDDDDEDEKPKKGKNKKSSKKKSRDDDDDDDSSDDDDDDDDSSDDDDDEDDEPKKKKGSKSKKSSKKKSRDDDDDDDDDDDSDEDSDDEDSDDDDDDDDSSDDDDDEDDEPKKKKSSKSKSKKRR